MFPGRKKKQGSLSSENESASLMLLWRTMHRVHAEKERDMEMEVSSVFSKYRDRKRKKLNENEVKSQYIFINSITMEGNSLRSDNRICYSALF